MRKLSVFLILVIMFLPLAFTAITLASIRPWVLDGGFYERILNNERLYEAVLTDELPNRINNGAFTVVEQLPVSALSNALREVVTPDYLQTQALNVVDKVFDYIDGRERTFELSIDITPIKAALIGDERMAFAAALAAGLPLCDGGQQSIAPGGRLTRCIAAESSIETAAEQIAAALPAVLEAAPSHIVINDETAYVRMNWYDYAWFLGSSVHTALDVAILMIATGLGVGFVGAYLGGDDLRGRLKWLSSALFAPGSLFLVAGLILTSPLIGGPISGGLSSARWGAQYSESFHEAVADVIVPVVQQIGSGILLTGIIACLISLALLIWRWTAPIQEQRSPEWYRFWQRTRSEIQKIVRVYRALCPGWQPPRCHEERDSKEYRGLLETEEFKMSESISIPASSTQTVSERRTLLHVAWGIVLLLTVPEIILRGFLQLDTAWILPVRIGMLVILLALTVVWPSIRPLRRLALIFLVIYGVESWFFGTLLPQSQFYVDLFDSNANFAFFGDRLVRIGATLVMLLVLLAMGLKHQDFFLSVGNLKAVAEAEKWGIPRKPETWPGFGGRYALIIITLFLLFMVPALKPSLSNLSVGLVLFAAVCAVMNAFAEEFLYRSALLPQVLPLFGKGASLILVASWFGIGHYFGVPQGLTGVIVTTIGGWVFAKAMVETRGMGWPLFLHFVSDFTIYLVILLAGGL